MATIAVVVGVASARPAFVAVLALIKLSTIDVSARNTIIIFISAITTILVLASIPTTIIIFVSASGGVSGAEPICVTFGTAIISISFAIIVVISAITIISVLAPLIPTTIAVVVGVTIARPISVTLRTFIIITYLAIIIFVTAITTILVFGAVLATVPVVVGDATADEVLVKAIFTQILAVGDAIGIGISRPPASSTPTAPPQLAKNRAKIQAESSDNFCMESPMSECLKVPAPKVAPEEARSQEVKNSLRRRSTLNEVSFG